MRLVFLASAVVAAIVVIGACDEDFQECYQQDLISCTCANGALGYAKCQNGTYGQFSCVCDGTEPGIDAGHPDAAVPEAAAPIVCIPDAGPDGSLKKDYELCAVPEECEGCRCETFNSKLYCTQACTADSQCPGDAGCNTRGICRVPQ
jgi:hypothetical protein